MQKVESLNEEIKKKKKIDGAIVRVKATLAGAVLKYTHSVVSWWT